MQRFLAKLRSFFWSWGFLEFVLLIVALLLLAYVEEDWRGTHHWLAAKAEWEAKGESFDPKHFVPPPVPDDQNIAALPLFKLENVHSDDGPDYLSAVTLRHAMRDDLPKLEFPKLGNWTNGELPDMVAARKDMAANYALAVKDVKPTDDLLVQFNAVYPFFGDFVSAAASRPSFRINCDYAVSPPALRPLGPVTDPIKLAEILTLHAILAEDQHQPDLALQDIKTNLTMAAGVGRDPTLVGGLVSLGVAAIGHAAIYNGLAQHMWSDEQLADLNRALSPVDFVAGYQFSMRGEAVQGIGNIEFIQDSSRSSLEQVFGRGVNESPVTFMVGIPWPRGWWDNNKRLIAQFDLEAAATVNAQAHLCFPKQADGLADQTINAEEAWDAWAPWKMLAVVSTGSLYSAVKKFAEGQVWIDEMRIACGLERFHLAHKAYPDSLDALEPAYLDAVPHDPMSGKPYRYQARADGTFLLYSVGWNQTDEGGTLAYEKDHPKAIDYDHGDWVWPTPKIAP